MTLSLLNPPPAIAVIPRDTSVSEGQFGAAASWFFYRSHDNSVTRGLATQALLDRVDIVAGEAASDNWDGDGAKAVSALTVVFAKMFIAALPTQLPEPDVSADNDGDISFDWNTGPRRVFSVSVRRDGVISWAGLFGTQRVMGSDVVYAGIRPEVIRHIQVAGAAQADRGN